MRDFSAIPPHLHEHVIIRRKELLLLVPYGMAHIYRLEAAKKFPPRVKLGERSVGWRLADVLAWLNSRPEAPATGQHEDA